MLTLSTSPEQENVLQSEAQKLGLSAEQLALNYIVERLPQNKDQLWDEEFDAGWDEAQALFDDISFGTKELRSQKDEEMALEEAKHARLFGRSLGQ